MVKKVFTRLVAAMPWPQAMHDAWWAHASTLLIKQRLWPRRRHGFDLHNIDHGQKDIGLHWLPERRMWALWLRVGNEVYADTKPKLWHFVLGIDDLLTRAEQGALGVSEKESHAATHAHAPTARLY